MPVARPLFLTADPGLADTLQRIAAAAGVQPDLVTDAADAAPLWRRAPIVVVGGDLAEHAIAAGLPRRRGLLLVSTEMDDPATWQRAVTLGAEHVVVVPDSEPWLLDRLADAVADPASAGRIVTVIGARGGAGATSFAVALALAAARGGSRTMLVDCDAFGGGIDLTLGIEDTAGPRWDSFADAPHPVAREALASALPRAGEVTVLAWPRGAAPVIPAAGVESVLTAARRTAHLVVVDIGRSFDEASRVALSVADVAVVVSPAEVRACAAGRRIAETVRLFVDDVRAVVRGPAATDLDGPVVAEALGLPLAGWLDAEPGIEVALDQGQPPGRAGRGPLAELCTALLPSLLPQPDE